MKFNVRDSFFFFFFIHSVSLERIVLPCALLNHYLPHRIILCTEEVTFFIMSSFMHLNLNNQMKYSANFQLTWFTDSSHIHFKKCSKPSQVPLTKRTNKTENGNETQQSTIITCTFARYEWCIFRKTRKFHLKHIQRYFLLSSLNCCFRFST